MLRQLTIRNFAIVDCLEIEWHSGLNVITGETGAGKSILIDAVGALLGDRLGPEVVRSGAQRALVEGIFTSLEQPAPRLAEVLDEYGLQPEDGALIVSREIGGGGSRGGARINGRSVPLSVLQELGEHLVDIHGQSEHMALLRPREQLDYLDRYAGTLGQRTEVTRLFRELGQARAAYQQLITNEREIARQADMLRHELAEIESARLREGEDDELMVQRSRLENAERLRKSAAIALDALSSDDSDQPGATDLLARAVAACQEGARMDPALGTEADSLQAILEQAEDSARNLRAYAEAAEDDPQALEQTVERLFLIGDLKRKFGDSIGEVLAFATDARRRLDDIEHRSERLSGLEAHCEQLESTLDAAAQALAKRRRTAADGLSRSVDRELADLRLGQARFEVSIDTVPIESNGTDRVDFRLAATAQDESRPIARVASGGELARIALALKTVLSRAETRPTLIFDEIDVGVGGRTAPVVGEKLWRVAAAGHQVLCVTHMAQVAAFAAAHYVVSRAPDVRVIQVEGQQRIDELAAMLAGSVSRAARESARELLLRASGGLGAKPPRAKKDSPSP